MDRELTREEFENASWTYTFLIEVLPPHLFSVMPSFEHFLNPTNVYGTLHLHSDYVYLGPTGQQRFDMLHSPHAAALLRAYAIQRLEKTNEALPIK